MASDDPSPHSPSLCLGLPTPQPSRRHPAQSLLGPSFHDPMYEDTGHILFAEDCGDTLQNTAGVACVHRLMPPFDIADMPSSLDAIQDTVKTASRRVGGVASKPLRIKTRKKNHSVKTVSVFSTHFDGNSKPSYVDKQGLANKTGMSVEQVSMWFNNKRKRTCGAAAPW